MPALAGNNAGCGRACVFCAVNGFVFYWAMPELPFHVAVSSWFEQQFHSPTPCQEQAWPAIRSRTHTLIAAPTGSGKTLAAFLSAIDALLREGVSGTGLGRGTRVVYVSPLKALSNDIQKNLQQPLCGIRDQLLQHRLPDVAIDTAVRTGDTTSAERDRMRRQPPHILVTTPESLYLLLTAESGRGMLADVDTVIVDEIHALAGNKRGAHLALSLQRLDAVTGRSCVRIGLSATQKPIERVANFLVGDSTSQRLIVDSGHNRAMDLEIELGGSPLEAVMANEVWGEVYDRLEQLITTHRTTVVFVNTRRLAERVARHLTERLGEDAVTSHHGSLAREHRFDAEQRLKAGRLKAIIATASLELGIDIGDVDLVCQIGSPRAISTLLQRVGRSGHAVGALPRGRLFPTSMDELVECVALLDSVRQGELEDLHIPRQPLDVLAQQIVAEIAAGERAERALFDMFRGAWPYRDLSFEEFHRLVLMLADGFATRRGRRSAHLHFDAVHERLVGRRGARLTALTNGGAIPDQFDYDVVLEPENRFVGTLNEDFAFESLAGDIFQLGNTSYRILRVERSTVRVEDAQGMPPNIPFWFGEAPGRSDELSRSVSRLRREFARRWDEARESLPDWMTGLGLSAAAGEQIIDYLGSAQEMLGLLPNQQQVVLERFFDESGDTHLVIHAPFGSRINRAWGLALRKRFCRQFNFELQAAALEDTIVLSLSATHSFPLEEVQRYLTADKVRDILIQALLDAPMFNTRWRWNATIALAVRRNRNGRRVPPQIQRMDAEDLVAVVFPDQLACLENIAGQREIPDHPLVTQTIDDCLHEAMDIAGLERVLTDVEAGRIEVHCRELPMPSPLAREILAARPYAFLDDAPAEERRTSAVQARGILDPASAADLGRLDSAAIDQVRDEAWPDVRTMDELHDALMTLGVVSEEEAPGPWREILPRLLDQGRATRVPGQPLLWVAAERLAAWRVLHPDSRIDPEIEPVVGAGGTTDCAELALVTLLRGRLECSGPVTETALAALFRVDGGAVERALLRLESEGFVIRGRFCDDQLQWCERGLLARINRYTVKRLRKEIEPVSAAYYMRFLFQWQGMGEGQRQGEQALLEILMQLEGTVAPARAWDRSILPARLVDYGPEMLDRLCLSGAVRWVHRGGRSAGKKLSSAAGVSLLTRDGARLWCIQVPARGEQDPELSVPARVLYELMQQRGALFFDDLSECPGLGHAAAAEALRELVSAGLVAGDGFSGLRSLLGRPDIAALRRAGRWAVSADGADIDERAGCEYIARVLLRRYGVVWRAVLEREVGLPAWRELLYVLRRLEARGEVRGGRFVAGFAGEQFALPEAVGLLRKTRREPSHDRFVTVCASDPLNLLGVILPGVRVSAASRARVLFRDGVPIAVQHGDTLRYLVRLDDQAQWSAKNALARIANKGPGMVGSPSNPNIA